MIWTDDIDKTAIFDGDCTLGRGVHVGPRVRIGKGCKVQNGAQLFEGVTLEDDVFIGPHVVFTNVLTPRAFISRRHAFQPTLVKTGASIGANATILCGRTIGEYAMVGAGAVVTRDVPPYTLVVGVPAHVVKLVCLCGLPLDDNGVEPAARFGVDLSCSCQRRYLAKTMTSGTVKVILKVIPK